MTYDRTEVASRTGVDGEYVDRLVDMEILHSGDGAFSIGDLRRVALVQMLERAGLPLEEVARTIVDGQLSLEFMDASSYDRFSTGAVRSALEMVAEAGQVGLPPSLVGLHAGPVPFQAGDYYRAEDEHRCPHLGLRPPGRGIGQPVRRRCQRQVRSRSIRLARTITSRVCC